jgi:hypothetical protein
MFFIVAGVVVAPTILAISIAANQNELYNKLLDYAAPKYLAGERLAKNDPQYDNAEGRAMVEIFNEDNGTHYCVPNLSERELVEFKVSLPLLVSQSAIGMIDTFDEKLLNEMANNPMQTMLRVSLSKKYPC